MPKRASEIPVFQPDTELLDLVAQCRERSDAAAAQRQRWVAAGLGEQFDVLAYAWSRSVNISEDLIRSLDHAALAKSSLRGGGYRPAGSVMVPGATRTFPDHRLVPVHMRHFLDDVRENWAEAEPVAVAAFAFLAINWVHRSSTGTGAPHGRSPTTCFAESSASGCRACRRCRSSSSRNGLRCSPCSATAKPRSGSGLSISASCTRSC